MRIGDREIGPDQPPYVIAELGVNHDGSVQRALELVQAARDAKADAVKLQFFETDRLLSRAARLAECQKTSGAADPFTMLRSLELNLDDMARIISVAHSANLHAIVTVFSWELVEPAARLPWDAFKIASTDLINRPLIDAVMKIGRPLLLSAGASTLDEIQTTITWLGDHPHVLMQCVSAYPALEDRASLGGLAAMHAISSRALGYSDHTTAIDTGGLAVAAGACVLEKHLTYDRAARGLDHTASLDPAAFAEYVRLAHRAHRMMGGRVKSVLDIEQDVCAVSRQSITSTRELRAGQTLRPEDLTIKRPGTGITPACMSRLIGRRTARAIQADTPLMEDDLA